MSLIGARAVAAAAALKPLGLHLIVSPDEFVITDKPGDWSETSIHYPTIEMVEAFIADNRRVAAAPQAAGPLKPLRYTPDATAKLVDAAVGWRVGDDTLTPSELCDRGFARASSTSYEGDWVQANGFQVRGLFRRGDGQRFTPGELRDLVAAFFAERGVEVEHPDMLEAFCFNIEPNTPGLDLDKAREQAAADMADVAAPLKPIELQRPRVSALVHYVSYGSPVRADGTQAYKSVCRAAMITEVTEVEVNEQDPAGDGTYRQAVGLMVANPTGQFFNRGVLFHPGTFTGPARTAIPGEPLPLVTCDDLTFEGGTWHWCSA